MQMTITINMSNAAFHEPSRNSIEVARILREIAEKIDGQSLDTFFGYGLRDFNGNKCGQVEIK